MYNKDELMDAIEAAQENIKTAKEQLKRLEKARKFVYEIEANNKFGYDGIMGDIRGGFGFEKHMNEIIEKSTENIKKYKKMLKLIEKMEKLENE